MALTRLDLFQIGAAHIRVSNPRISPDEIFTTGANANIYVGVTSVMVAHVLAQLAQRIADLYLDSARGEALDRLGKDRYDTPRKGAAPAVGSVTFFRATNAAGAGSVPVGTLVRGINNILYITTSPAPFGSSDLSSTCDVRATEAGSVTEAGENNLRSILDVNDLWDVTLQVTNPNRLAGGTDREGDDDYKERLRAFWKNARRGTLSAIQQGALTVEGVASALAIEALGYLGLPARIVSLYIADPAGISNTALAQTVSEALDEYRAAGIPVIISTSIPQIVDVQVRLSFRAAVDTIVLTQSVLRALVEYVNSVGVGSTLTRAGLLTVLLRFQDQGLVVTDAALVAPTGDLVPDAGRTIRTTLDHVFAV